MTSKRHINLDLDGVDLQSGKFKGNNNYELHFNSWKSKSEKPKAVLILVHGLGDHSGHYMTLVQHFVFKGFAIYGYDQRGHGLSSGKRGHIEKFDDLIQDLDKFVTFVHECEKLPLFLFGNSMGGCVTVCYSLKIANPLISAIIVNAPALSLRDLGKASLFFVKAISVVYGSGTMSVPIESEKLTKDPEKTKENDEDELVHADSSYRLLAELGSAGGWARQKPQILKVPALLVQGDEDPIVDAKANVDFFTKVKETNSKVTIWQTPKGKHEVFNDVEREQMFVEMEKFLAGFN